MRKAQPDHVYNYGPEPRVCVYCGIIRGAVLAWDGTKSATGKWSSDGGKTWTTTHSACPRVRSTMSLSEKVEPTNIDSTVLDHGYVKFIENWGSDERIIEAARMSTDKGFQGWGPVDLGTCATCEKAPGRCWNCSLVRAEHDCHDCSGSGRRTKPGDEKLLKFLYDNRHDTPFEMSGMTLVVQAPIFVFREWHRHRTQSYNEMSARYTPLPDVNYIPTVERLMINSKSNKQAGVIAGAEELTLKNAEYFRNSLRESYEAAEQLYQVALRAGVPKELARIHLPVGRYSRMMASANLRNWLAFLTLRMAPNAQWEIRQFANAVGVIIADRFPRTWALYVEGR